MRHRHSLSAGISDTPYAHAFRCELDSFQGPLDLLVALVQRHEIDVFRVMLREILLQVQNAGSQSIGLPLDAMVEALALSATLMLLKSRGLTAQATEASVEPEGFSTNLIEHLIAYCHIKLVANHLGSRFEQRSKCRTRPPSTNRRIRASEPPAPIPEEPMSPQELVAILKQLLERQAAKPPQIADESWSLSDALLQIEHLLRSHSKISFESLCELVQQKDGWIALFLAVLELLKRGARFEVDDKVQPKRFYLCQ